MAVEWAVVFLAIGGLGALTIAAVWAEARKWKAKAKASRLSDDQLRDKLDQL